MRDRIRDKIIEIETFLEELESVLPSNFEEYRQDFKVRSIGERYFEKIIEAVVDLSFFLINERKLRQPEHEKESFDILEENGIISKELSSKLSDAKGMRNIIAHEYGKIDDELVFHSLTKELIPDVQEFIKQISNLK